MWACPLYDVCEHQSQIELLTGEWTFTEAAFPDEFFPGARRPALLKVPPAGRRLRQGYWSGMVCVGLAMLDAVPTRLRSSLNYEELLTEPDRALTRLAGFLGLAAPSAWLASARGPIGPSRRGRAAAELSAGELDALRAACSPGTEALADRGHLLRTTRS